MLVFITAHRYVKGEVTWCCGFGAGFVAIAQWRRGAVVLMRQAIREGTGRSQSMSGSVCTLSELFVYMLVRMCRGFREHRGSSRSGIAMGFVCLVIEC